MHWPIAHWLYSDPGGSPEMPHSARPLDAIERAGTLRMILSHFSALSTLGHNALSGSLSYKTSLSAATLQFSFLLCFPG